MLERKEVERFTDKKYEYQLMLEELINDEFRGLSLDAVIDDCVRSMKEGKASPALTAFFLDQSLAMLSFFGKEVYSLGEQFAERL